MSKLTDKLLFELIRDFFTVYLPQQRCCSEHTIRAYRTALNQLLDYIKAKNNIALYKITFAMLTKERILEYLDWLETGKNAVFKQEICGWRQSAHFLLTLLLWTQQFVHICLI